MNWILHLGLIAILFNSVESNAQTCLDNALLTEDGNTIAYRTCGEGETLVFIHAGGLDQHMWDEQVQHFKSSYRVVTYDLRGHGNSTFHQNDRLDSDDLLSILKKEKSGPITLIGCSLGAIEALDMTLAHPDLVKRLVLVSPGLIGHQEKDTLFQSQMSQYVQALQRADTTAMEQQLLNMNALGTKDRLNEAMHTYVTSALFRFVRSPGLLRIPMLQEFQPIGRLAELSLEVFLIVGGYDHPYILGNADFLLQNLPNARMFAIPHTAHLPGMEKPEEFNALLESFLK